jgi:phosphoribosylanthranilate isomerase
VRRAHRPFFIKHRAERLMFDDAVQSAGGVRVKICGICNVEDARAAAELGADALGLNGCKRSKRYIDIQEAGEWLSSLPRGLRKIAVLVDPDFEEAIAVARLPFIDSLQLHGSESPDFCRRIAAEGVRFAKAVPISDATSLAAVPSFHTRWIVMDSAKAGVFGGSGTAFPWPLGRKFIEMNPGARVILAGGLTPENVAGAITTVRPFGVDVTTGVESVPGRKDHARLRAFIESARRASAALA